MMVWKAGNSLYQWQFFGIFLLDVWGVVEISGAEKNQSLSTPILSADPWLQGLAPTSYKCGDLTPTGIGAHLAPASPRIS